MTAAPTTHVVGAGLAGLAAAVRLAAAGKPVVLHEAAPAAGGRCRSFHDATLDRRIDNGNHLVLSGNQAVRGYLRRIGAESRLVAAPAAEFPFVDLADGARWQVSMGRGVAPLWAVDRQRRPPGMSLGDVLGATRLTFAPARASVADAVADRGPAWSRFWLPLTLAVMNAPPERASARLLAAALLRSFALGGRFCRPMFAPDGLGEALVTPALAVLRRHGAALRFLHALRQVETDGRRATALIFDDGGTPLGPDDRVVLALPPSRLAAVLPGAAPPAETGAILNAHFRVPPEAAAAAPPILGVLSAHTQWIFRRGDVLSVTISAADASPLMTAPREAALTTLWHEVRAALAMPDAPLAARLLKEKRATFDQSPEGAARRLPMRLGLDNVLLAGDHVATGLPATIEGAIRSGDRAARAVLRSRRGRSRTPAAQPAPARA